MGKTDADGFQGTLFPPQFLAYWEKSCRVIEQTPDIRYIDELRGEEYEDFDGLCVRSDGEGSLTLAVNRALNREEAMLTLLHEITHAVLFARGFWEVRAQINFDMIAPLATCYSSVLTDPLIDHILRKEGFAVDVLLKRDLRRITTWFIDPSWEEPDCDDPVFEMEVLRFVRLALSGDRAIEERLDRLYQEQAQEVRERAHTYIGLIGEVGFDSPERQLICLKKMIHLSLIGQFLSPCTIHTVAT